MLVTVGAILYRPKIIKIKDVESDMESGKQWVKLVWSRTLRAPFIVKNKKNY